MLFFSKIPISLLNFCIHFWIFLSISPTFMSRSYIKFICLFESFFMSLITFAEKFEVWLLKYVLIFLNHIIEELWYFGDVSMFCHALCFYVCFFHLLSWTYLFIYIFFEEDILLRRLFWMCSLYDLPRENKLKHQYWYETIQMCLKLIRTHKLITTKLTWQKILKDTL